jgi:hypothetical protein
MMLCKWVDYVALSFRGQPRPNVKIRLIRLFFLLTLSLDDELRFSDELLLVELASEDVLLREPLKPVAPTISSRRTSYCEVV